MKKRIIVAIIALAIVIPLIIIGGNIYYIGASVVGLLGLKEFFDLKELEKKLPNLVKILAVLSYVILVLSNLKYQVVYFDDIKNLMLAFFLLLMPIVTYSDNKKYNINDAFFMISAVVLLGITFNCLIVIRNINLYLLLYLLSITIITDTFAYFTGLLIGRNKLCPNISPNKTVEGFIGGLLVSTVVSTIFYTTAFEYTSIFKVIIVTALFSIIGQIGDLIFSAIKRQYKIKDFSNIMPGHGGILDRLDSLILILISYSIIITIL